MPPHQQQPRAEAQSFQVVCPPFIPLGESLQTLDTDELIKFSWSKVNELKVVSF